MLFVGEDSSQERERSIMISRPILILIFISIFVPHSLWYSVSIDRNFAFYRFALVSVCWVLIRKDTYLFSDLYSSTSLQFPGGILLFIAITNFVLQLIVISTQSRYLKGFVSKITALIIILVTLGICFWIDGYTYLQFQGGGSSGTVPFPIFYILNIVSVFWQRESKMDSPDYIQSNVQES